MNEKEKILQKEGEKLKKKAKNLKDSQTDNRLFLVTRLQRTLAGMWDDALIQVPIDKVISQVCASGYSVGTKLKTACSIPGNGS